MRVANNYYKTYAELVQNLKAQYNKSMQKVSSGRKYETGADNPSAYYQGEKLENLYNDVEAKDSILGDVLHRMEQQEASSKALHTEMGNINTTLIKVAHATEQDDTGIVDTVMTELKQRQNTMTQDLNLQYENYYVMGGNDSDTVPFSSDFTTDSTGKTTFSMTYHHKFAGDSDVTHIKMTYDPEADDGEGGKGAFTYDIVGANGDKVDLKDSNGNITLSRDASAADRQNAALDKMATAMEEQGRMSLGYGTVVTGQRDTLPDTYFGGLNMITGLTSDQMRTLHNQGVTNNMTSDQVKAQQTSNLPNLRSKIKEYMNKSAFGLNAKAIDRIGNYQTELNEYAENVAGHDTTTLNELRDTMTKDLGGILDEWDNSMSRVISTTRHIGVTYNTLSTMQSQLQVQQDTYQTEYDDKLGVDTADAITKMYSDRFAYNAALQVGSKIMQNSLFDFVQ